ncbi:MAG: FxsA family protein [Pseudomonadota bacterium]
MPFSLIPLLLLIIPLAEIAAFVVIGREIGVLWTLAMVFFTAVLGSILLRVQGFGLVNRIRQETEAGRVPGRELVHGVMILIAGVLLLTPGFITDAIGFLLFVPAIRDAGWRLIKSRITIVSAAGFADERPGTNDSSGSGPTIDLGERDFKRDPDPDSPWKKDSSG